MQEVSATNPHVIQESIILYYLNVTEISLLTHIQFLSQKKNCQMLSIQIKSSNIYGTSTLYQALGILNSGVLTLVLSMHTVSE